MILPEVGRSTPAKLDKLGAARTDQAGNAEHFAA